MTAATMRQEGEFRIGNVINRAWGVLFANFLFFFCIAFVVALPNLLLLGPQVMQPGRPAAMAVGWTFGIAIVLGLVLHTLGQAVILFGAFQHLCGQPVQPGEAIQRALSRFFPLVGLAILYTIGITLGFMLLIVPGFMLMVRWAITVPACVVEKLGPVASMGRSARLTKGHRWKIFGTLLLMMIVNVILNQIVGFLLRPTGLYAAAFGSLVWMAVWGAFWHCLLVMIYHDLRVAKEGIDTRQIASVFD